MCRGGAGEQATNDNKKVQTLWLLLQLQPLCMRDARVGTREPSYLANMGDTIYLMGLNNVNHLDGCR